MNPLKYIFAALFFLVIACSKTPLDNGHGVPLAIKISFTDESFVGAFGSRDAKSLGKSAELIVEKVLELNPEQSDSLVARDVSGFNNNASLLNVLKNGDQGKAFYFNGENSYGIVNHAAQLNGAKGLRIIASVWLFESGLAIQTIVDKTSPDGGYWLGIENGQVTFKIVRAREEIAVRSGRALQPGKWAKIEAGFAGDGLYVRIDDGERIASDFAGPVPVNTNPVYIGAKLAGSLPQQTLYGAIESLTIFTATEYVDIEQINIAVLDLTKYDNADSLLGYDQIYDFVFNRTDVLNSVRSVQWAGLYEIIRSHFPVVATATLPVEGGIVEGTIQGVQGLNFVAVAAVAKGVVSFYGEALFYARRDQQNSIDITLYEL